MRTTLKSVLVMVIVVDLKSVCEIGTGFASSLLACLGPATGIIEIGKGRMGDLSD